jgi:glycosyltransferase involved in cell wall biosynthesis
VSAVLLVAPVPITTHRTGPAIRYWELARVLSAGQKVSVLAPNADHPTHPQFNVCACAEDELDGLLAAHQVIVVQGPGLQRHPRLAQALAAGQHYLVVDLYDPITLEQLEIDKVVTTSAVPLRGRWLNVEYTALLNEQIRLGDFFLSANERQRDYWLGALAALGRVNQDTYDSGDLRRLIDVVPFGLPAPGRPPVSRPPLPEQPKQDTRPVLKGVLPGIAPSDRVILWGGGLWEWLDPLTPIRAMAQVRIADPTARLVFFESARFQPPIAGQVRQLAADMGLLGREVVFAEWLPPEQWSNCLLEADVGLSFHPASIETHFAFRTRLIDYMGAGLPIVTAGGDVLSEQVAACGLGYVVEPGNAETLAAALIALLAEPDARRSRQAAFHQVAEQYRWERVAAPLVRYCREPWRAGDAESNVYQRWQQVERDRLISEAAGAWRRVAEIETQYQDVAAERDRVCQQADDLARRLQHSETQFQAAMNGRVMRLMSGMQRAMSRWRRRSPTAGRGAGEES